MNALLTLDNPQQLINAELSPNEKLLWSGRPPLGLRLHYADIGLIPFSLLWSGITIGGLVATLRKPTPALLILIPFAVIAIWLLVGRFFTEAYIRSHTFYGITSQRIIIISGVFSRTVASIDVRNLPSLSITEQKDRRATIDFFAPRDVNPRGNNLPYMPNYYTCRFYSIEEGRNVYELIRSLKEVAQ